MTMTKQTISMIGGAVIAAIVLGGVLFGVMPLRAAAAEDRAAKEQYATSNTLLAAELTKLEKYEANRGALELELADLKEQIPATANLASATRVIVAALGAKTTLVSIVPQVPPVAFAEQKQLTDTIDELGTPNAPAPATPADPKAEEAQAKGFQEVPLSITANSADVTSAFEFIDALNNGPRAVAVRHVAIGGSGGEDGVPVTIQAAVFLDPRTS